MRNQELSLACLLGLLATLAPAQENQNRNFSGTWQLSAAKSTIGMSKLANATWSIEQNGLSIAISRVEKLQDNKETKLDIRCTTDGKECAANGMKTSLWYDGNALVELDVGGTTTEYHLALTPDKALTVDVTHIDPAGDKEKLLFSQGKISE